MIVRLLLLGYLSIIALIVLAPDPIDSAYRAEEIALAAFLRGSGLISLQYWQMELAANVVLFLPLGLLLTISLGRSRISLWLPPLFGAVVSTAAEIGQLLLLPDRFPSPIDVISNTLGVVLGWCIALPFRRSAASAEIDGPVEGDGRDAEHELSEQRDGFSEQSAV
ncbi:MAG: VanZ family protein [Microbacterium sp.]|uniref:VanZ family protein n=1 Tax=Microbacterium sp. TaxID=51671 RepID=UPI003BAFA3CA